jgi:hypothetical protein
MGQIRIETTNGNGELTKVKDNQSQELFYSYNSMPRVADYCHESYLGSNGQFQSKQLTSTQPTFWAIKIG